ncbi:peptidase T [Philodulcilactobacillus myokoensis]|uniref:Peptidase T n=1 Tax=Philodulcilactobacillus myokoensis TaxID=2929573 RepID=A0A9W6B247_9LACO|nr:peptidase T [Philodulcilactobacillus myokoensis]GLB47539.1 peptidase T [Philodulcilactobacillus myokoensis]
MSSIDTALIQKLFIKYCRINTRSDPNSKTTPTTRGQVTLAHVIMDDLNQLGIRDVEYDQANGYVTISVPSNIKHQVSPIGFIAHLDTADFPADNLNPEVHHNYDGQKLLINQDRHLILDPDEFPALNQFKGQTLITSDGTTLLGADDKAGIAALIGALKSLKAHPEIKHGPFKIAFGPDEEIGRGAKKFDAKKFNTKFAYTLDNGAPGDFKYQTFNASQAEITFQGTTVHPGSSCGTMVSAIALMHELIDKLDHYDVPRYSKNYDGFHLITHADGTVEHARLKLILRDFDTKQFHNKEKYLKLIINNINCRYQKPRIHLKLVEQYHNIGDVIKKYPMIIELALKAYKQSGLKPNVQPFRGGTDGNFITPKGIPTPNLFNAGGNFHGPYEYVSVEGMEKLAEVVINILKLHAEN